MESQAFSWHWLGPVLFSSLLFLTGSAAILRFALRSIEPRLNRLTTWLRWVLVLPSALAFSWAAEMIPRLMFFLLEISANHRLTYRPGFEAMAWQLFAPIYFVLGGLQVAPGRKIAALLALGGLRVAVAAINLTSILRFTSGGGGWDQLDPVIGSPLWWNAAVYVGALILLIVIGIDLLRLPLRDRGAIAVERRT